MHNKILKERVKGILGRLVKQNKHRNTKIKHFYFFVRELGSELFSSVNDEVLLDYL